MRANELYVGVSYPALTWGQMIRCTVLQLVACDGTAAPGKNPTLRQQSPTPSPLHQTPALSALNSESRPFGNQHLLSLFVRLSQADPFLYRVWNDDVRELSVAKCYSSTHELHRSQ